MAFWSAWENFWFRPSPPTTLAVMRIFTGLIMLYVHFGYALALPNYVGRDAWVNNETVMKYLRHDIEQWAPNLGWDRPENPKPQGDLLGHGQHIWSIYFHVTSPFGIAVVHAGIIVVTLLFTLGVATRITSVLTWAGAIMYINRANSTLFGMDTMTNLALLYLMIAPCGAALSVDRWVEVRRFRRQHGTAAVMPPVLLSSATFATRLMQVNFCFIYMAAGTSKLLGATWWNATAPYLFLLNYSFAPFNVGLYARAIVWLAHHRWLWEILAVFGVMFTLFTELAFSFLVWNRKLRWLMMCCSALLHTMIGLLMGLVTFSLIMLVLLLAFMPPEVTEAVLARIGSKLRGPPRKERPKAGEKVEEPLAFVH
jgi:hypothetical protein